MHVRNELLGKCQSSSEVPNMYGRVK